MCVGKCSRIVGPCLLVLGTLSVAASILLLFPAGASKYLLEGHISSHAKAVPGVWGGGIAVSTAGCTRPSSRVRSRDRGMERGRWLPFVPQLRFHPCRCCWQGPTSRRWGGSAPAAAPATT